MLPGTKYIKSLKLSVPEIETITEQEIINFFQDFITFSQLQNLEIVDTENSHPDFLSLLTEHLGSFRFLKSIIIHGNFNYSVEDIKQIVNAINPDIVTSFGLLGRPICIKNIESIMQSLREFRKLEELILGIYLIYDQGSIEGLTKFIADKSSLANIDIRFVFDSSSKELNLSFKEFFRTVSELPMLKKLAITHNSARLHTDENIEYFDEETVLRFFSKRLNELRIDIPSEAIARDFFETNSEVFDDFLSDVKKFDISSSGNAFVETYGIFIQTLAKHKETLSMNLKLWIQANQFEYFANNFLSRMGFSNCKLDLRVRGFDENEARIVERLQKSYPEAKINLSPGKVYYHVAIQ